MPGPRLTGAHQSENSTALTAGPIEMDRATTARTFLIVIGAPLLLDRRILVRGGFYEGARNTNGIPMVGGMVRLNLVGDETAYTYPGIYLDEKTRISIGVGGQYQPRSGGLRTGSTAYDDYAALAADLFADVALGRTAQDRL